MEAKDIKLEASGEFRIPGSPSLAELKRFNLYNKVKNGIIKQTKDTHKLNHPNQIKTDLKNYCTELGIIDDISEQEQKDLIDKTLSNIIISVCAGEFELKDGTIKIDISEDISFYDVVAEVDVDINKLINRSLSQLHLPTYNFDDRQIDR